MARLCARINRVLRAFNALVRASSHLAAAGVCGGGTARNVASKCASHKPTRTQWVSDALCEYQCDVLMRWWCCSLRSDFSAVCCFMSVDRMALCSAFNNVSSSPRAYINQTSRKNTRDENTTIFIPFRALSRPNRRISIAVRRAATDDVPTAVACATNA